MYENFEIDNAKKERMFYVDFFNENNKKIRELLDERAKMFIQFVRYKYDIGIGDIVQSKSEFYWGKPKIIWITGYSAYSSKYFFHPLMLSRNDDLRTHKHVCLSGLMYDPVTGEYKRKKNIHFPSDWKKIAYKEPLIS